MNPKKAAAESAADFVQNGMVVGLGTGSTAFFAIHKIAERILSGLKIHAVATSVQTENIARELNIPIISFSDVAVIDLAIDGADEVDPAGNLIKGGGGALLREKVVASNSRAFHVVVDHTKMVQSLGRFPLPIEIFPFAYELTLKRISAMANKVSIRKNGDKFFITDNGNLIVDGDFYPIAEPAALNVALKSIPGVAETGIFTSALVTSVTVGLEDGGTNRTMYK
jgi:ribose 5-phosphate isomerase A